MHGLEIQKGEAKKKTIYTVTATFTFTESDLTDPNPITLKKKQLFDMMVNEDTKLPDGQ